MGDNKEGGKGQMLTKASVHSAIDWDTINVHDTSILQWVLLMILNLRINMGTMAKGQPHCKTNLNMGEDINASKTY